MLYSKLSEKPFFILGPCVIESMELLETVAQKIIELKGKYNAEFIFKASFDKANRTSLSGNRGLGLNESLQIFADIKSKFNVKIITDVHESHQCEQVKEVVDIIQIPAFLCRQTDLTGISGTQFKPVPLR
jgi:2-dehydro-3-deoxyphosphooctonate aldolase (KDO 8-P synthase)